MRIDDGIEPLQRFVIGKHHIPQLLPVQRAVGGKYPAKGRRNIALQSGIVLQHLVIDGIAVQYAAAHFLNGTQRAGFPCAAAAGKSDDDLLFCRHRAEARRLFQTVDHRQVQAALIGALGIYFGDCRAVEGTQRVKHAPGMAAPVALRPQRADDVACELRGIFVKADDACPRRQMALYIAGTVPAGAGDHRHRCFGGIVAVLHTGCFGLFAVGQPVFDRLIHLHVSQHIHQQLQRQTARTQQTRRCNGQVDDGALHPHGAGAAIHDAVDLAHHILRHMLRGGRAGSARGIAAGRGDGHAGLLDDSQRQRMVGTAHAHRFQPAGGAQRHNGAARQDHGQRAGPELLRQRIGAGRHIAAIARQPIGERHMDDKRIVLGTALGLENAAHRLFVQRIRPQTVDRFRGNPQQAAAADDLRRRGNRTVVCVGVKNLCFQGKYFLIPKKSKHLCQNDQSPRSSPISTTLILPAGRQTRVSTM